MPALLGGAGSRRGSCRGPPRAGGTALGLALEVLADLVADEAVADGEDADGQDEDAQCGPGDVGSGSPWVPEVCPAVQHPRALAYLPQGEDEDLGQAEQAAEQPRSPDHHVGLAAGLLQGVQRVAHGHVAVQRHHDEHVGGGEHAQHLQVLDRPAERVWAQEAVRHLPDHLRQHLEERNAQVGQPQVQDEEMHPAHLLPQAVHRQQHPHVAYGRYGQDGGQHPDLCLGQLLIPGVQKGQVGVPCQGLGAQQLLAVPRPAAMSAVPAPSWLHPFRKLCRSTGSYNARL